MRIDKLIRTNRKSIALIIDDEGQLVVRAPLHTPIESINEFVDSKNGWINKHKTSMLTRRSAVAERSFAEGEEYLFFGRSYCLMYYKGTKVRLLDNNIMVPYRYREKAREALIRFYKDNLLYYAANRLEEISEVSGIKYSKLKISSANKRWGSCNSNGSINLTYKLCMAHISVIDYVIVHELSHIVHMNHSKDFWQLVERLCPDYKAHRMWLKKEGYTLRI